LRLTAFKTASLDGIVAASPVPIGCTNWASKA
jgi:hypothetical protein